MDDCIQGVNTVVKDDTLDYALLANLTLTVAITAISLGELDVSLLLAGMIFVTGLIWTFTITPYIIAQWLNTPVEKLVQPQT
jgi:hypothetical protein